RQTAWLPIHIQRSASDALALQSLRYRNLLCAQDSKRKATARNAACINKFGFRILQQLLDDCFRIISVRDLGVDHVVIRIVSTEHAASAKVRRIFSSRAVALARLSVNKNRSGLGIRTTRRNRSVGK